MQGSISSLLSQAPGGHGPESQLFQAAAHLQPVPELGGRVEQQQSQERRHQLADVTFDGWQCHPQHSQLFPLPLGVVGMRELPYFGWQRKALPLPVPSILWEWPSQRWEAIWDVVGGELHTHVCCVPVRQPRDPVGSQAKDPMGSQPRAPDGAAEG